ncbi:MAG TPA: glycoside hydrolase family 16 protein [Rugosimonospora sp.]|nr:glycoside hydrolase family 16 protein [Rugosimonospora sp.]
MVSEPLLAGRGWARHPGRLAAVAAALLVLVGGSGFTVWRLSNRSGAGAPAAAATQGLAAPPPGAPTRQVAGGGGKARVQGSPAASSSPDPGRVDWDDFTGPLDTTRWSLYENANANGSLWSHGAIQVTGGELQIVGTGKNPTGKGNVAGGLCWCGTNGDQLYGVWKIRARFDAGAGYSPVLGLWPRTNSAADGYITAVLLPDAGRTLSYGGVVWGPDSRNDVSDVTGTFTAWHVITIEWRATYVKLYLDGRVYYDSTRSKTAPQIPRVPMHLYVQVEPGPKDGVPAPDASTPARVVTHIDWVKLYR